MYIGSTDSRGLMHCLWEIIDNSVDEALGGHGNTIDIVLHPDESVEVRDTARGIPVDIEPKTGLSGVEVVFTKLHAGGKFGSGSYAASGGLHGVGASVVNALSERLDVDMQHGQFGCVADPERQAPDRDRVDERRSRHGEVGGTVEVGSVRSVHLAPSAVSVGAEPEIGLLQVAKQQELTDAPLRGQAKHVVDPIGLDANGGGPALVLPPERNVLTVLARLPPRCETIGWQGEVTGDVAAHGSSLP